MFAEKPEKGDRLAKCEVVALMELKTRLPAKLLPLVEEYRGSSRSSRQTRGRGSRLRRGMTRRICGRRLRQRRGR